MYGIYALQAYLVQSYGFWEFSQGHLEEHSGLLTDEPGFQLQCGILYVFRPGLNPLA